MDFRRLASRWRHVAYEAGGIGGSRRRTWRIDQGGWRRAWRRFGHLTRPGLASTQADKRASGQASLCYEDRQGWPDGGVRHPPWKNYLAASAPWPCSTSSSSSSASSSSSPSSPSSSSSTSSAS